MRMEIRLEASASVDKAIHELTEAARSRGYGLRRNAGELINPIHTTVVDFTRARPREFMTFSCEVYELPLADVSNDGYFSVTELAELLGISRQAVLLRIDQGILEATKVGTTWIIPKSAVQ